MNATQALPDRHAMRGEYLDRLAAYRFASRLRASGAGPDVHVWHTSESVIVELVGGRPSDASHLLFAAETGDIG